MTYEQSLQKIKSDCQLKGKLIFTAGRATYLKLLHFCHPDKAPKELTALATEVAALVNSLWKSEATVEGYTLTGIFHTGSISEIFTAVKDGEDYLLKVPHTGSLTEEAEFYRSVKDPYYFANFVESLGEQDILVFRKQPHVVLRSLAPKSARYATFVWKRILECLIVANRSHGNITPDHVLIDTVAHTGFIVDWTGGKKNDVRETALAIVDLLGGDLESGVCAEDEYVELLNKCLQKRVPKVIDVYNELKRVAYQLFGEPKYVTD